MQLDIEQTKIDVTEELVYESEHGVTVPQAIATVYIAELNGTSVEGHTITMQRQATSPDAAIKALFEGMTAAGVSL